MPKHSGFVQAKVSYGSILLKKSAMVSTVEKYALEIEIFTLSSGFRVQISRSSAQKRCFQRSVSRPLGRTDFFNRIGRLPSFETSKNRPEADHQRRLYSYELLLRRHGALFKRLVSIETQLVVVYVRRSVLLLGPCHLRSEGEFTT